MSPRRLLTILFLANLFIYITRYLLAGVLPSIERAFSNLSQADLGALASIFVVAYWISSPLLGAAGDRFPRRRILTLGAATSALATATMGIVTTFRGLLATRVFLGLGQSAFVTLAPTFIADAYPPNRRAGAISTLTTAQPVGTALSYLVTGLLVGSGLTWRSPFIIIALPALMSALWMLRIPLLKRGALDLEGSSPPRPETSSTSSNREDPSDRSTRRGALKAHAATSRWRRYLRLLQTPSYLLNTLAMSANAFAMGGLAYWMPTYLHKVRGVPMATADIAFGLITAAMGAAGTLGGGAITERLMAHRATAPAWVSASSSLVAVPLFYIWFHVQTPAALWGVMAAAEILLFIPPGPANTLLLNVTDPEIRGVGVALNIILCGIFGDMLSPFIIGLFADRDNMTRGIEVAAWAIGLSGALWIATAPFVSRDRAKVIETLRRETALEE